MIFESLRQQGIDSTSVDSILKQIRFKPVRYEDIDLLQRYFMLYPSRSCDYSVGGVVMWADYFDYEYSVINGSLLLRGKDPDGDREVYYGPVGAVSNIQMREVLSKYCNERGIKGVLIASEERDADTVRPTDNEEYEEKWMEYLYDIDKIATFSGRKMEKKRNHLNFLLSHFPDFRVEIIRPEIIADLISFTFAFQEIHEESSELFRYELNEVTESLRRYAELPYFGIAVRINGKIEGYSFGERIGDTFFVHVEKGDSAMRGVYPALASRMAMAVKEKYPGVRYLNREEDMGDENLRRSKQSYHPSLLIDKRIISL